MDATSGVLTSVGTTDVSGTMLRPHAIAVNAPKRKLYLGDNQSGSGYGKVQTFSINQTTGVLTSADSGQAVSGDRSQVHLMVSSDGSALYAVASTGGMTHAYLFSLDSNGLPTYVMAEQAANSSPRFRLFEATSSSSVLSMGASASENNTVCTQTLTVSALGTRSCITRPASPWGGTTATNDFAIDLSQTWILALNQGWQAKMVFAIPLGSGGVPQATGVQSLDLTASVPAQFQVSRLALHPSRSTLFFVGSDHTASQRVIPITLNTTTGAMTAGTAVVFNQPVREMQVDPSGAYLLVLGYNTGTGDENLSVYSIDSTTGALTLAHETTTGLNDSRTFVVTRIAQP